jgi:hypothetical protein
MMTIASSATNLLGERGNTAAGDSIVRRLVRLFFDTIFFQIEQNGVLPPFACCCGGASGASKALARNKMSVGCCDLLTWGGDFSLAMLLWGVMDF